MSERWRSAESAPKDGSTILVYGRPRNTEHFRFSKDGIYTVYYDLVGESYCLSGSTRLWPFIKPKYWMPLPEPPKETE